MSEIAADIFSMGIPSTYFGFFVSQRSRVAGMPETSSRVGWVQCQFPQLDAARVQRRTNQEKWRRRRQPVTISPVLAILSSGLCRSRSKSNACIC